MPLDGPHGAKHETTMLVYKIFRAAEFQEFQSQGRSAGAPVDLTDGYIHLSTAAQVPETLARHFAGLDGLHLLALDSDALTELLWEPSRGGDLFPHLYRELQMPDLLWSRPLTLGPDGHVIGDLV
ncbi:DUF952 domain-containing protein [Paracoccus methylovorus]|uniref:DUF952 domain-containing protein n=2 Tax=Paracoccaceae TaxID=31989 RepID=A0ABX7JMX8_9RHOB|nr:DUF952 domain-containing protein [Paracoccus methylovorus]